MYLGYATERIGVLNMGFVAVDQTAAFEQEPDAFCGFNLAFVVPDLVKVVVKRLNTPIKSIQSQRGNNVG
jgi:hypothetical protein